ncbi:MAG TPA: LysE family transporter [Candidatus Desulfobacillus sp.]|nr:LysE family transporter [Candidatus Desulfobacillus sp.]
MTLDAWLIYLLAALGLSLSPGPNGLLALSHGALHGSRKTLFTLCGSALGFTAVIALSMFGIGALVASSAAWLTLLKWLGGAYLVWLGLQLWRAPPVAMDARPAAAAASGRSLFRQGFLSAATNPKALLFFTAFLPLFIEPRRSLLPQFATMAATFVLIEFLVELALASAAQRVRPWLERAGRRFNRACGGLFMAIGAALPLRD